MSLKDEISAKRKDMVVDSYPMSIGEITNIYKDDELEIHPEFQRFYRWDEEQKTKFIESILLGIPVPPIFVSQNTNGIWDVIDGQQRLATIFQFLGVLKKEDGTLHTPLVLRSTKFLPSLEGVTWNDEALFFPDQKITFKREKLNFYIIKETSENSISKYEIFQRLNTGGTHLSAQEIRNCLMIMINKQFYNDLVQLNNQSNFRECISLTEMKAEERFDLELVVRYILYTSFSDDFMETIDKSRNMDIFLTEQLEKYAENIDIEHFKDIQNKFDRIFTLLKENLGENSFKKYTSNKFKGQVLLAAFEAIIPGLFINLDYWESNSNDLVEKIKKIYSQPEFATATRQGTRSLDRMIQLIKFSRKWFKHEY